MRSQRFLNNFAYLILNKFNNNYFGRNYKLLIKQIENKNIILVKKN